MVQEFCEGYKGLHHVIMQNPGTSPELATATSNVMPLANKCLMLCSTGPAGLDLLQDTGKDKGKGRKKGTTAKKSKTNGQLARRKETSPQPTPETVEVGPPIQSSDPGTSREVPPEPVQVGPLIDTSKHGPSTEVTAVDSRPGTSTQGQQSRQIDIDKPGTSRDRQVDGSGRSGSETSEPPSQMDTAGFHGFTEDAGEHEILSEFLLLLILMGFVFATLDSWLLFFTRNSFLIFKKVYCEFVRSFRTEQTNPGQAH